MTTSTIKELLTSLGQHLGVGSLQLDEASCCQLLFDQRWVVTLIHQGALGRIALNCPLGSAQSAQALGAGALRAMLQANFMGRGTGRFQLSICPEGRIFLTLELALTEADSGVLVHALEQLLNQAETWSQWIEGGFNANAAPLPFAQTQLQPMKSGLQSLLAENAGSVPRPPHVDSTQRLRNWTNQRV